MEITLMDPNTRKPLGLDFLFGGHAYFTVDNGNGQHYSFRVSKPKPEPGKPAADVWFVSVLTGPDNTRDYTYAGMLNRLFDGMPSFTTTKKSKYTMSSLPVVVFRWATAIMAGKIELPEGYSIQHMGKCCVCGRPLTDPESIRTGIGPICAEGGGL